MEAEIGSSPSQEIKTRLPQWDSAYKPVALQTLEKLTRRKIRREGSGATEDSIKQEVSSKREKLKSYMDAIDQEAAGNFGVFESKEDHGVRFPYTKVSVNKVASYAQNQPLSPDTKALPKKTYVIFTPFIPPPGGAPDDDMNSVYDRVLTVLPEIAQRESRPAKDIEVYALGLPTSRWGSISEDWLSKLKEHGFSQYGELYAEFLRTVFPQETTEPNNKRSIIFFGGSMGTILADQTARQLPEIWKNLRVLLDGPTGVHKPPFLTLKSVPLSLRGLQVVLGFGAEAAIRMYVSKADNIVRTALANAKPARDKLDVILQKRGVVACESNEENRLKKAAYPEVIKLLIKGTPLDTESFRSHIAQPMLDPATTTPKRMLFLMTHDKNERFFNAGNRSLGMGVKHTHWMDRGKWPNRWLRAIERYEK